MIYWLLGVDRRYMADEHIKLRKAQLMIAKEVKRICEKYNIKYFLDAGSMLGAVRHGGFIPWDDDLDIGMLKSDYERFLEVAQEELGDAYFVDNYTTNEENPLVFTKIRLVGTKYIENKANNAAKHQEIFVDIFPYYHISDDSNVRKREAFVMRLLIQMLLIKGEYKVWKGESKFKVLKFLPIRILAIFFKKQYLKLKIESLYNRYNETEYVCVHDGTSYSYWHIPKYIFYNFVDTKFENEIFRIPKEYDKFLKIAYGNYMVLPPEQKRITHQIIRLDMGKYLEL